MKLNMKDTTITKNNNLETETKENRPHSLLKKAGVIILILFILLFCNSRFWIHKTIQIKEYPIIIESLPSYFNGFKITHFSDIHYGRTTNELELQKMVEKINLTNADIIVFTGDLFDNGINLSDKNIDTLKNSLSKINAKQKKYAIKGDNDLEKEDTYTEIMTSAGFQILENQNELIFHQGNTPIQMIGISSLQKEKNLKESSKTTEANIALKILLSHEPIIIEELNDEKIDLILSGHSLGGLINLPYIGPILKKENTNNYQNGFYELSGTKMYVSSGIGTEKYSFRFQNKPSINLYRFYNYN